MSGDLTVRGNGKPLRLRASSVSGNIDLTNAAGTVDVVTVSGDARVDIIDATEVRGRTTSGSLDLRAKLTRDGRVDVEGVSGDITLRVSAPGGFSTEIESFSGDIQGCLAEQRRARQQVRSRRAAQSAHGRRRLRECGPRRCRATSTSAIVDSG